jgi:protein arginine N-methyltransferase 1
MHTYSLDAHGWMLGNAVRTGAYIDALRRVVKPGDIVLDIGTGVGTFALAACRFGARRVHAIDPSEVIEVARELAAANGCADRIELVQALSTDVTLSRPADVLVEELHGVLPMFGPSLATIIDARARLLKPGGILIPRRERLWAALVDAPDLYAPHDRPGGGGDPGFNLDPVRSALVNHWIKRPVRGASIVEAPQVWAALDYATLDSPDVRGRLSWTVGRPATLHGLAVWFDSELADGVGFSNAPDQPGLPYGQAFFPWGRPVRIDEGDRVEVELVARLLSSEYVWCWAITVTDSSGARTAAERQSDFWRDAIPPAVMQRAGSDYAPRPNPDRAVDAAILDGLDRGDPVGAIAGAVRARVPGRFDGGDAELADRILALAKAYGVELPA